MLDNRYRLGGEQRTGSPRRRPLHKIHGWLTARTRPVGRTDRFSGAMSAIRPSRRTHNHDVRPNRCHHDIPRPQSRNVRPHRRRRQQPENTTGPTVRPRRQQPPPEPTTSRNVRPHRRRRQQPENTTGLTVRPHRWQLPPAATCDLHRDRTVRQRTRGRERERKIARGRRPDPGGDMGPPAIGRVPARPGRDQLPAPGTNRAQRPGRQRRTRRTYQTHLATTDQVPGRQHPGPGTGKPGPRPANRATEGNPLDIPGAPWSAEEVA
jgi:hypothetical protein